MSFSPAHAEEIRCHAIHVARAYPADYCLRTFAANGACILPPFHDGPCADANAHTFDPIGPSARGLYYGKSSGLTLAERIATVRRSGYPSR